MDHGGSVGSSLNSTGDTSHLLQELINLQKSNALSTGTLQGSIQVQDSVEPGGSGEATNPTLTELMKTFYDNPAPRQLITLQGSDTANSFSVFGREVDIIVSKTSMGQAAQPTTGSNKVKITPVVKYDWDVMHYIGNLVAIHKNSVYAAYSLRGKSGGVVRVVNRRTAERTLLKDFVGRVVDIAFAHTEEIIIGAVDEMGNLAVYGIHESEEERLVTTLMMNILRTKDTPMTGYHRVIWCPFIPDDCDDSSATESSTQDASRVLVLTHDEKAEIWNVDLVTKEHSSSPILANTVEYGLIKVNSHTQPIMDAAFSPDGTALATASLDGEVKFFQVNMGESSSPRCLHQWKPHDGKQLSSLFFLDDHKFFNADAQFWRFAVTGANNNQELKIWSCESWNCLQTVRFMCPSGLPSNFQVEPCMKAALDMSAKYLVLSDIKRQVLYVLHVHQDSESNTAHVSSVSEFLLAQPCLSFAIMDASKKKFKKSVEDDNHLDDITTGELDKEDLEEGGEAKVDGITTSGIQIKLYTVHPKTLQELQIRFRPESSVPPAPTPSVSTVSHDDTGIQDGLSDMSMSMDTSVTDGDSSKPGQLPPLLLTPEAFTTSPRKYQSDNSVMEPVRASGSSTSSFTHVTGLNDDFLSPHSSADHSAVSVGSTNTQTPTSKEPSPGRYKDNELTPSGVPLPPQTNSEKQDLETPTKSKDSFELSDETTPTPTSGERLAKVCIDDLFDTQGSGRQTLERTNFDSTSSTTGFEVNDVIGAPKHSSSKDTYDENDEEVAEVLGESYTDDREVKQDEQIEGTQPFEEQTEDLMQSTGGSTHSSDMEGKQVLRAWPRPPDVDTEGQVTEAAEESAYQEDEGDDDVRVEGEEEICEEDEEDLMTHEDVPAGVRGEDTQGSSEEQIEEQSEESEQDSPKEAPVAKTTEIADIKPLSARERTVEVREIRKEIIREVVDKEALAQLQNNLQSVLVALESQNAQIERIQYQLAEQQEHQAELQRQQIEVEQLRQMAQQPQPNIDEHLGKLEGIVTSRVERIFNQHSQREQQRIQEKENRDRDQQVRMQQSLTQTLHAAVSSNMERQIRAEMKNTVLPSLTRVMEPMKDQLHHDLAQKLTATDSLLKDSITKMVRSKQTVDAIGMAAGNALQTPIQAAYREAFQNIVVPNFERATQTMFQQVNDSFTKGSQEYTRNLESHLEKLKHKHTEARDPIVAQLRKLTDSFQTSAETMQTQILATLQSQVTKEMQTAMANLQDTVVQSVRQAVKEEVSIAVREQGASISDSVLNAMRSGAVTPVQVTPDPHQAQTHILQLLRQGQLNSAFQEALSASNLELVMFVCETVNPSQVFNQSPCPLQQPVLLSLIQQLSADLGNHTDLKNKYLEEAVMNLDTTNHITREHIKSVLYGLIQKLKTYISAHPNAKSTRSLKMLQMASESLLK